QANQIAHALVETLDADKRSLDAVGLCLAQEISNTAIRFIVASVQPEQAGGKCTLHVGSRFERRHNRVVASAVCSHNEAHALGAIQENVTELMILLAQ